MQHFIKRIEIGNRFFNFYYNLIHTVDGIRFHVSVVDNGRTTSFLMQQNGIRWEFVNKEGCPFWITGIEKELSNAIFENINA